MKSPKGILSESIAEALAEYFVVDPKRIETNLVTDAGVTLHDVELKPVDAVRVNAQTVVSVTGSVRSVAFQWKWGGDSEREGGSSFVSGAKLSINGLDFTARLSSNCSNASQQAAVPERNDQTAPSTEPVVPGKNIGKIKAYIDDQVNRIIDTLTLAVTDFQFKVQIDGSEKELVFGGSGLKLESFGRKTISDSLKQELTIERIFSNILITSGDNEELTSSEPLLDAVSYKASCTRVSGKRFHGGIATGFHVIGEAIDAGVSIHAGADQLRFLINELGGCLLEKRESTANSRESKENGNDPHYAQRIATGDERGERVQPEDVFFDASEWEVSDVACTADRHRSAIFFFNASDGYENGYDDMHSYISFFQFPLSAVSLFFPNETKLSMAGLVLNYKFDGSALTVEGRDGFLVNGFPFLRFPPSCQWQADLVKKRFRIHSTKNREWTNAIASIHARSAEIDSVIDGTQELLSIVQKMSMEKTGALGKIADTAVQTVNDNLLLPGNKKAPPQTAWTFGLEGGLSVVFEDCDDGVTVDCLVRNIDSSMQNMTLSVGTVEKLRFPGSIRLSEPLKNTTLSFDDTLLTLTIGDIVATLEEPPPSQLPADDPESIRLASSTMTNSNVNVADEKQDDSASLPFVLPFGGKLSVSNVTVYETDGQSKHTTIKALQVFVGPDASPSQSGGTKPTGGVRALLMVEEINFDMIRLTDPKVSGIVYPDKFDAIQSFQFGARAIAIATGYSVFDWKRLLETGDEKRERKNQKHHLEKSGKENRKPLKLPFAHVQHLKCRVAVKGELVETKGSTIHLDEFKGTATTTVDDLVVWYSTHLISNVPGFVSDADVLGFNVADTAAALASLGAGAGPVGGLLGIVGFDAVKHTVKAGKKSRGAEEDDKAHFLDFFRGIGQASKDTASGGAALRGKKVDDKADAIDWALGATSDVASYTNKNKSRLGGAGAAGVGFVVGFALGGPVGGFAGALIAAKTTSATIDTIDKKISKIEGSK